MENVWDKSVQEQLQFASISEFKDSLVRGGEVEFQWKGIVYNVSRHQNNGSAISHSRKQETEKISFSPDELLEHPVSGDRLRDVIKQVDVRDRMV